MAWPAVAPVVTPDRMHQLHRTFLRFVTISAALVAPLQVASHPEDLSLLMMRAASTGDAETVEIMLLDGASPNSHERDGIPMLTVAAATGHVNVIEILIASGADIDAKDALDGGTALHWAAAAGQTGAIKALLDAGANPTIHDDSSDSVPASVATDPEIRRLLEEVTPSVEESVADANPSVGGFLPLGWSEAGAFA